MLCDNKQLKLIYVTCASYQEAKILAKPLVEKHLSVCCNIISGVSSIYQWEGRTVEEQEFILLIKTLESNIDPIFSYIKDNHSYDNFCFLVLDIDKVGSNFMDWVQNEIG